MPNKPTVLNVRIKKKRVAAQDNQGQGNFEIIIEGNDFPASPSVSLLNTTPVAGSKEPSQNSNIVVAVDSATATEINGNADLNEPLVVKAKAYTTTIKIDNEPGQAVDVEVID
ncbi:MAG: hypothetical protein AAF798_09335 [Bacteroidota bacterium]